MHRMTASLCLICEWSLTMNGIGGWSLVKVIPSAVFKEDSLLARSSSGASKSALSRAFLENSHSTRGVLAQYPCGVIQGQLSE